MLTSRMLRSELPTTSKLLQPQTVQASSQLRNSQQRQKSYYDRSSKSLKQLNTGNVVRLQRGKLWEPAIVIVPAGNNPRSYIVNCGGREYRRNRRHLRKTNQPPPIILPPDEQQPSSPVRHIRYCQTWAMLIRLAQHTLFYPLFV
jgi:hypothetical protein